MWAALPLRHLSDTSFLRLDQLKGAMKRIDPTAFKVEPQAVLSCLFKLLFKLL